MRTAAVDISIGNAPGTKTPLGRVMRKWPVLTYFILTIAISWTGFILIVGPDGIPLTWERFERLGPLIYAAALAGPSVAGVVLTGVVDGRAGMRDFLARLRRWRVGARSYALAVQPALILTAIFAAMALLSPAFVPAIITSDDKVGIVLLVIAVSVMFGFFEELGWSGFAVPKLRLRHGATTTGIVVGVVWGAWHFPLFWEADTFSGPLPLIMLIVRLFSWLPAARVLMVWLHDRTGSLLLPMLLHATLVATSLMLVPSSKLTGAALWAHTLVWPATLWLIVAGVTVAKRAHSTTTGTPRRHASSPSNNE